MGKRSNNDHHDHDDDDVGESPEEKEYPLVVLLLLSFTATTLVIFSLLAKFHQDEPLASSGLSLSLSLSQCHTLNLSTWLTVCDFELTFHSLFLSSTYLFTTSSENY